MNEILKNELCKYLGQLMYEHENEFYFILKDRISEKINAVNKLLDIDKTEIELHHFKIYSNVEQRKNC